MDLSAFDLKGKVALITGGAHGIGFSIAEGMAKCGATICFNCSSEASLEKGMAAYKAAGIDAHGYAADVSDEDAVNAMVAKIMPRLSFRCTSRVRASFTFMPMRLGTLVVVATCGRLT